MGGLCIHLHVRLSCVVTQRLLVTVVGVAEIRIRET